MPRQGECASWTAKGGGEPHVWNSELAESDSAHITVITAVPCLETEGVAAQQLPLLAHEEVVRIEHSCGMVPGCSLLGIGADRNSLLPAWPQRRLDLDPGICHDGPIGHPGACLPHPPSGGDAAAELGTATGNQEVVQVL